MAKKTVKETTPPTGEEVSEEIEETAEQDEQIQQESAEDPLQAALNEAADNRDLYLRALADLENYRKRAQREKEDAIRFANDRLLKEMVPVLDNLERAIEHAAQEETDNQGLLEGVNMTITQFRKALEDFGVKAINAIGTDFDPNLHQAMGQIESAEQAPNTVVTEFQKGYLLHDRLLRPSLVIVAKAPETDTEE